MKILCLQSEDGLSLLETDLSVDSPSVLAELPDRMFSQPFVAAQFEGTSFVVIDVPPEPELAFGETATRVLTKNGDIWEASWSVSQQYTLADARTFLRTRAMEIAREKLWDWSPSVAQWNSAGQSMVAAYSARGAAVDTQLVTILTNIQNASTIAEAYTIYQQLQAL